MQESQCSQLNPNTTTTTMVKSLPLERVPLEESQLCDDILSCILALDEVIAEFDDTNSLSSFTSPDPPATSCVPISSVPLGPTKQTTVPPTIHTNNNNNNNHHPTSVKLKSSESGNGVTTIFSPSIHSPSPPALVSKKLAPITTVHKMMTELNNTSSQVQVEVKQCMLMHTKLVTSFHSPQHPDQTDDHQDDGEDQKEEEEEDGLRHRLATELREDLIRKSASPSGKCTKIPTLKNASSSTVVTPSLPSPPTTVTSGGGGGGSFPKVKMRGSSGTNPLLEYRSVKMSNFVLPDELPAELMKENWCFTSGKNLPRSLARTRETCITEGDGQIPKSKNPRFTESTTAKGERSGGGGKNSRIPRFNKNETNGVSSNIPVPKPRKSAEKSSSPVTINAMMGPEFKEMQNSKSQQQKQEQFCFNSPQKEVHPPIQNHKGKSRLQKRRLDFGSPMDDQKIVKHNGSCAFTTQGHSLPETDDGYLSMINRSDQECPVLWPEEMIENEIFSEDELKRLSFIPTMDGGAEKTDYFSDDSLESETTGFTESFSSASNGGKGTYSKPTKIRSNAKDYFGNPEQQQQQCDTEVTVGMNLENRTPPSKPVSFFVPLETPSPVLHHGIKRKGKQKKFQQALLLNFNSAGNEETVLDPTSNHCAKNIDPIIVQDSFQGQSVVEKVVKEISVDSTKSRNTSRETSRSKNNPIVEIGEEHKVTTTVLKKNEEKSRNEKTILVNKQVEEEPILRVEEEQDFSPLSSRELEIKESEILRKIEDFAEKLAAKIERSGSEEAAATLTLNQVEIELQNLHSWTPSQKEEDECEKKKEEVIVMSNNVNTIHVPGERQVETDETLAENLLLQKFRPISQNEEKEVSEQIPVITSINIFIPGENPVTPAVAVSNKTEPEDRNKIVSKNNVDEADVLVIATNDSLSKDQFFDLEESCLEGKEENIDMKPHEIVKALGITAEYVTQDGKRGSVTNEDEEEDDLSETPPEFIPELPPSVVPIPQTDYLLDKIAQWNATVTSSQDDNNQNIRTTNTVPKSTGLKSSSHLSKGNNGTTKSFSHSTNGTYSTLREESDVWKPNLERNSRSSEDLIQALNSDTRTSSSMNRLGASTLPLNTRPPSGGSGGPLRPIRNMFNRFRRSKNKRSSMSLSEHSTTLSPIADLHERPNSRPVAMYLPDDHLNEADTNESRNYSDGSERRINMNNATHSQTAKKPGFFMRMFSRKK